jgi:hypothetical protein
MLTVIEKTVNLNYYSKAFVNDCIFGENCQSFVIEYELKYFFNINKNRMRKQLTFLYLAQNRHVNIYGSLVLISINFLGTTKIFGLKI